MGRKKATKSAQIRQLLDQNPKMEVKEVVSTLGTKGVKVPPSMVYYLRARGKRSVKRQQVREVVKSNGSASAVQLIMKVKSLATEAGGYDNLRQLVDILAK